MRTLTRRQLAFAFLAITALLAAFRITHSGFLWADDTLPLSAAYQMTLGKTLYRDVWFDKPPLVSAVYLFWNALPGFPLRLAGAIYFSLCCAAAYAVAAKKWGPHDGLASAGLMAIFVTFDLPSAIIPLAADSLLVLPHLAAIYFAWRKQPFLSGCAAGVGLLCNSKAVFVLAACALWQYRQLALLLAGFATPNMLCVAYFWSRGSLFDYYREVWQWGSIYAAHSFVEHPWKEGATRTLHWLGFHAALVIAAIVALRNEAAERVRFLVWMALALAGIALGTRFFPRYYFLLLVPTTLLAARGMVLLISKRQRRWALVISALLLLIPLIRFGPRYVGLGRDFAVGRTPSWNDVSIDLDSQRAGAELRRLKKADSTLLVWGFRSEIFVYAGMPSATKYLESQPLSGMLADRHFFDTRTIAPDFVAPNRNELLQSKPDFVVDGLGPYNPKLSLADTSWLATWMQSYQVVARTSGTIIYQRLHR